MKLSRQPGQFRIECIHILVPLFPAVQCILDHDGFESSCPAIPIGRDRTQYRVLRESAHLTVTECFQTLHIL